MVPLLVGPIDRGKAMIADTPVARNQREIFCAPTRVLAPTCGEAYHCSDSSAHRKKEQYMTLKIEIEETERLAREIAQRTGETPAQAILTALRERLARLEHHDQESERRFAAIMAIGEHCANLPVLDARHPDEISGYDEYGLPH